MITREQAEGLRDELLSVLAEDPHNTQRLLGRLDAISRERGISAHSALLLILTHLGFDDQEARRHWARILEHHKRLGQALGRDPGVRVALLDYFVNVNRQLLQPTLIDLEMLRSEALDATRCTKTGLSTDRVFRTSLQHELRRARRYAQQAAVVLFDLDDFEALNQRLGQLIGDRVLREAAILVSNSIRDIDLAGRPGEDEFALLLPETDRTGALEVAERVRVAIEKFFAARGDGDDSARLTVSAGVACYPQDAKAPDVLLERAAQALYQAKAWGKNKVQTYLPERRRYLRFDLEPERFEVEVLNPAASPAGRARNLSRNGILFLSPESLEIGEQVEIRLAEAADEATRPLRLRGSVVRVEELPEPLPVPGAQPDALPDRFEIGVAFDEKAVDAVDDMLAFLRQAQRRAAP